jgi:endonuclease-3
MPKPIIPQNKKLKNNRSEGFVVNPNINELFSIFKKSNPDPITELNYTNPFTLLIAVLLSAQSTDKGVNKATDHLFKCISTPQDIIDLGIDQLIELIKTIGLFRNKAKNIMALAHMMRERFGPLSTTIPNDREFLESLPGVGRKTANVVLGVVYHLPTMPVDTHILRLSHRLGLSNGKNPLEVEEDLLKFIPDDYLLKAHHWLILHGRYVCVARKPKCESCIVSHLCPSYDSTLNIFKGN